MTHFKKILLVSMVTAALNGCMALGVLGLGAVGASSIADRRSTGAQTDDQIMELRVKNNAMTAIKQANPQSNTTLSIISYNRKILLVGQADNENDKALAEQAARSETNQERVYNYITVSPVQRTISDINRDTWITSKVRSRVINVPGVYAGHIKVVTFNNITYLMGMLTPEQQAAVVERVRTTAGVQQIVTLFEAYQPALGHICRGRPHVYDVPTGHQHAGNHRRQLSARPKCRRIQPRADVAQRQNRTTRRFRPSRTNAARTGCAGCFRSANRDRRNTAARGNRTAPPHTAQTGRHCRKTC